MKKFIYSFNSYTTTVLREVGFLQVYSCDKFCIFKNDKKIKINFNNVDKNKFKTKEENKMMI